MIPDYDLLRVVGRGAYGDVWLARGLTGIYCAIKVVWRDRFPEVGPYEHELCGLRAVAQHPGQPRLLALLHVGRNDAQGFFYYVMELADDVENGRRIDPDHYTPLTLKRWLQRGGNRPSVKEVISHGIDLARGLAKLHASGLVHRDIKPSNLVVIRGRAKLADIGLITDTGVSPGYVGTEGFVPPEGTGTPQADVFGLGKVLYEFATGRDRHDYPRLPADLHERPDRDELLELNEVIVRACDPSPRRRHPTGAALLEELLLLQLGGSVRRLRRAERSTRRAYAMAAALAMAALVALGGALQQNRRVQHEMSARLLAEAERDQALRRPLVVPAAISSDPRNLGSALTAVDLPLQRPLLEPEPTLLAGGVPPGERLLD